MNTVIASIKTPIKFGTDGWRAVMAEEFTFAALERVAQAYATFLKTQSGAATPTVIVGFDNRFLSAEFAKRTAQILLANGIGAELFPEPVPTPLVSFAVIKRQCAGGVVITASHNPPEYNGFKIKDSWGGSAFETTTRAVEQLIDKTPVPVFDSRSTVPAPPPSVQKQYIEQLSALVDLDRIRAAGLNIVVDSMHGTAARITERLLSGGKTTVTTIRANRDCLFGGCAPEPIDKNLAPLKQAVSAKGAIAGVATDGDADRLGAVNEQGRTMTMHEVAPILLEHLIKNKRLQGSVVATVTQSVLMKRMAEAFGSPYLETPVGFKYIAAEMLQSDVLIGAEESGGIGVKGHIPERDGILNGLLLLEAIATTGKTPTQLVDNIHKQFGAFSYDRVDMHVPLEASKRLLEQLLDKPPAQLAGTKVVEVGTSDGIKLMLSDDCWLMFRRSGTEPVLRIYAEGTSADRTQQLLTEGKSIAAGFVVAKM